MGRLVPDVRCTSCAGSRSSIVFIRPLRVNDHHFILLFTSLVTHSWHFYHFRGCRQAQVTTRLLLLLGPSVGESWRMLPVIVELPLDRRDPHRTTAVHGRACRPNGRWALRTGLGCNGLADGRILSTGVLRPLKPSQEPSSMHFGTAHSALDRLEGGSRLRTRSSFGCGPPTGLDGAQHPSARALTGEGDCSFLFLARWSKSYEAINVEAGPSMCRVSCLPLLTTPRTTTSPIWPVFAPHSC